MTKPEHKTRSQGTKGILSGLFLSSNANNDISAQTCTIERTENHCWSAGSSARTRKRELKFSAW